MIKPKKVHYVDNQKFYQAIVEYRQKLQDARTEGLQDPRIPNYIGECIWKIADKLSTKPCFMNYSYRDEMISDGVENCIMYFKDYDPVKGQNPFAYFTQVIYYAFIRRISKEEKNRYIIYKNFQNVLCSTDMRVLVDHEDKHLLPSQMYDNINDFMSRFEKKEEAKKAKRKLMKENNLLKFYEEKENEGRVPEHTLSG
jgi:hypothetical protein